VEKSTIQTTQMGPLLEVQTEHEKHTPLVMSVLGLN